VRSTKLLLGASVERELGRRPTSSRRPPAPTTAERRETTQPMRRGCTGIKTPKAPPRPKADRLASPSGVDHGRRPGGSAAYASDEKLPSAVASLAALQVLPSKESSVLQERDAQKTLPPRQRCVSVARSVMQDPSTCMY